jgi:hypothetical protein
LRNPIDININTDADKTGELGKGRGKE